MLLKRKKQLFLFSLAFVELLLRGTSLYFNLIQDILNNSTVFTNNQIRIENDS